MPRRPTLIVAEQEPLQALSVRKLLLETAKFNVLTAHSTGEALDVFQSFPNVAAAIVVAEKPINCEAVAEQIKNSRPDLPVIALSPLVGYQCPWADHHISSHEPEELLKVVRDLLGDPRQFDGM